MSPTPIAAIQLSSQADVGANLDRAEALIAEAAARGAKIALLPENFAYLGGDDAGRRALAEDLGATPTGPIARRLADIAQKHRVHVLAGGMPERSGDPDRPYNTIATFAPDGRFTGSYRKIHLFDVDLAERSYRESGTSSAGSDPVVIEALGLRIGLSICYDLRFPELYRALAAKGADILVVPAAFTVTTGKDHWHVLLRARAIESQAYVVAAAQWGKHPGGRMTFGKSCIIDPWGEIIAQASEGEGMALAPIDLDYLRHVRQSLPSLQHRRLR